MESSYQASSSSFTWSDEALNIKSKFHDVDIIVYVEGEDDIRFWEIIFEKFSAFKVMVEDLGGCVEVKEKAQKILEGKINAIAALDKDLHAFTDQSIQHSNVLYTKGYSIENTLISPNVLIKLISNLGKYKERDVNKVEIIEWLENLYIDMKDLIMINIYTHIEGIGESIIGDSGDRFLDKSSARICQDKLDIFLTGLKGKFLTEELLEEIRMKYDSADLSHWLKGHFLFTSVQRFISYYIEKYGQKISISRESFYSNVILAFEIDFNERHAEYEYYQNQVMSIDLNLLT